MYSAEAADYAKTKTETINEKHLPTGDRDKLAFLLGQDVTIIRASGEKQDRQMFLEAVEDNKNRGRFSIVLAQSATWLSTYA